jgi:NAD(P)-dependent dehydrogenase (short-subunit alcohol dehydrogenase family)
MGDREGASRPVAVVTGASQGLGLALAEALARDGWRLVVNSASTLGASPLPTLSEIEGPVLRRIFEVNVVAPLLLLQALGPSLARGATVVNITSDAAVEAYEGWGGYGASKAALEHSSRVLAAERPDLRVVIVDPGDMRTEMHQDAFPGEDISDRPEPEASVRGIMALIDGDQPSGRYRARDAMAPEAPLKAPDELQAGQQ